MAFLDKFTDTAERDQHLSAIRRLAEEFGVAVDDVRPGYELELQHLYEGATIKEFLSIFATRAVRDTYRHQHGKK
ncbi:MAG: hypothetical protein AB1413_11300 [Thermodesulfobacteriota bacterium]|jgi:hypothetical protein